MTHTHTHGLGRNPLDEGSACRRDLYLTTHNTHNRQTSMSPAGFELTFPAIEWSQTYSLDSAAAGIGWKCLMGRKQVGETSSESWLNGVTSAMSQPSVLILPQQLLIIAITQIRICALTKPRGMRSQNLTPNALQVFKTSYRYSLLWSTYNYSGL